MNTPLSNETLDRLAALDEIELTYGTGYPNIFRPDCWPKTIRDWFSHIKAEETILLEPTKTTAGRVLAKRRSSRYLFLNLFDGEAEIQLVFDRPILGEESFKRADRLIHLGDFIGITFGEVFRTRTGELSLRVSDWVPLAKALNAPPSKHYGLDAEARRYQRYADLLVNTKARRTALIASRTRSYIRRKLEDRGLLEVKTPVIQPIYGGAEARPFTTSINAFDEIGYLRISPELYLKRLVVAQLGAGVYEICENFRNEGMDARHFPEFTAMEVYQPYADYNDMMALTESLISGLALNVNSSYKLPWVNLKTGAEVEIDLTPPWPRKGLFDLVREATKIDLLSIDDVAQARQMALDVGLELDDVGASSVGRIAMKLFDRFVEPTLVQPTFVIDYPREECPLTKRHRLNPRLAERFELYVAGLEFANAYTELNDPREQEAHFRAQETLRAMGDEEAHPTDWDFVNALRFGMPPAGGLGIGIDRLVMLMAGETNIRDVILFPYQRRG